jgi:hypothetical protein
MAYFQTELVIVSNCLDEMLYQVEVVETRALSRIHLWIRLFELRLFLSEKMDIRVYSFQRS